jgi:hypothetical protein
VTPEEAEALANAPTLDMSEPPTPSGPDTPPACVLKRPPPPPLLPGESRTPDGGVVLTPPSPVDDPADVTSAH